MDINVELNLWISTCKDCGNSFKMGMLPGFEYGRRIILTEDGLDCGIVNFFEDETCQKISLVINKIFDENDIPVTHKGTFFDLILNLICDDINGKKVDTAKGYVCKYCHSSNLSTHECNPVESEIFAIPAITHKNWEAKSQQERFAMISEKLNEFITREKISFPFKKVELGE